LKFEVKKILINLVDLLSLTEKIPWRCFGLKQNEKLLGIFSYKSENFAIIHKPKQLDSILQAQRFFETDRVYFAHF